MSTTSRNVEKQESTLEKFLRSIEARTTKVIHHRLLKACRERDPSRAMESEFRAIVNEIINET